MKLMLIGLIIASCSCSATIPPYNVLECGEGEAASTESQAAYAAPTHTWKKKDLSVCWENATADDVDDMWLVEDSINRGWLQYIDMHLTWYRQCELGVSYDIHIQLADTRPSASVGYKAGVQATAVLNFTLTNWCTTIPREQCIIYEANHEAGHFLIGLMHEQDRPDAPKDLPCEYTMDGEDKSEYVEMGKYDPNSVMNYCSETNWPDCEDVKAAQALYNQRKKL